jgi:hypothetical protein
MTEFPPTRRGIRASVRHTPVFVDASGRRLRGVRVVAGIALTAAVSYVGLLASAVLGGPTIEAPFLPQPPVAAQNAPVPSPQPTASENRPARPAPKPTASFPPPIVRATPAPSTAAPAPATAPGPSTAPASDPTPAPQASAPGRSSDPPGKSGSAPGQTRKPTPPSRP